MPGQRLAPTTAHVGVRDDGITARAIELVLRDGRRPGHVVVEMVNPTSRPVRIAKDRLASIGLREYAGSGRPSWGDAEAGGSIGAPISGPVFGTGGSSSPGGSWASGVGGGLGGGAGVLALIFVAPLIVPAIVDGVKSMSFAADPPAVLRPRESARFAVPITMPVTHIEQHVALGAALDDGRSPLDVPVVHTSVPHGGWRPHRRVERLVMRVGGGPFTGDRRYSGTALVEALAGGSIGPTTLRVSGSGGLGGALGLEVATAHDLGPLQIAPSIAAQVGWALIGETWYGSPTFGLDLTFPVEHRDVLALELPGVRMGIYGRVGPVWTEEGRFVRWETGLSFR